MRNLTMKALVDLVRRLQGQVPEEARILFAQELASMVGLELQAGSDPKPYQAWLNSERDRFFHDCLGPGISEVTDSTTGVILRAFCERWESITQFKYPSDPEDEWSPITYEMNCLRLTMLKDLKEIFNLS
jgi:hypothetical protein